MTAHDTLTELNQWLDQNGEMPTRSYDYQDPANTGSWSEGSGTFASVIADIAKEVRDNAE